MKKKGINGKGIRRNPIITHALEGVSKTVFKNYADLITDLVGRSPGVYALYDDMGLYYVGKSINLKGRVHHHVKDKHAASWSYFSLYLLKSERYVDELESLLICIANPKGNRTKPRGSSDRTMLKKLRRMVKKRLKEESDTKYAEMFNLKVPANKKLRTSKASTLVGLVKRKTRLFRVYKGKEYKATLTPKGIIEYGGRKFNSPSSAGQSIVKHGCNGWRFWYLRDKNGDVINLDELRSQR